MTDTTRRSLLTGIAVAPLLAFTPSDDLDAIIADLRNPPGDTILATYEASQRVADRLESVAQMMTGVNHYQAVPSSCIHQITKTGWKYDDHWPCEFEGR